VKPRPGKAVCRPQFDGTYGGRIMELTQAVRSRSSTAPITDEGPSDEELLGLLAVAAHSPDHASLRPWRLVSIRGDDRRRLGGALAAGFGDLAGSPEAARTASKALRAPLLLGIVTHPLPHRKVPEWEQIAATVAMVTTLQLLLFEAGWTAMWRTGPAVELSEVRAVMGIAGDERLLGWLYVGRTVPHPPRPNAADPDVSGRITPLPPS
jgi:nitroreductase